MQIYKGYSIIKTKIRDQGSSKDRIPIVLRVESTEGLKDGMLVAVDPEKIELVKAAFREMKTVLPNKTSESLVDLVTDRNLIVIPSNGVRVK
jgi:exosome complex RNA-binding protein Rrp4